MTFQTLEGPPACLLAPDDLSARLAWIARLNARALVSARRSDLQLTLEYRSLAVSEVEQLIRYEQSCCGFLSFRLDKSGDNLVLTITAPESARRTAAGLLDRFRALEKSEAVSGCCAGDGCSPSVPTRAPTARKRATRAMAATTSAAIAACALCCTLPFIVPATLLASTGGILAWVGSHSTWMTAAAAVAVATGWAWTMLQSWHSRRRPAPSMLAGLSLATATMAAAWLWPIVEVWAC